MEREEEKGEVVEREACTSQWFISLNNSSLRTDNSENMLHVRFV